MKKVDGHLLIISHSRVRQYGEAYYCNGGFGRTVEGLAERFDRTTLMTCVQQVDEEPNDYHLRAKNTALIVLPAIQQGSRWRRYLSMLDASYKAFRRLRRAGGQADVVHPRLPSLVGAVGALWLRRVDTPGFYYVSTDWHESLLVRGGLFWQSIASVVQRALRFLVESRPCFIASESLTLKYGGPSEKKIPVLPTVLERENIASPSRAADRVQRPPREALFVGQVWAQKGIHILLEAIGSLRAEGLAVNLRIVGEAEDGGEWLREQLSIHGLGEEVVWEGHLDWREVLSRYDSADVFVMPSLEGRGETGPKVVLEAMARGVPVVASRVGFVSTVMENGKNGLIVDPGSSAQIADGIRRIWTDVDLRVRFAKKGIATASRHTMDSVIDLMVEKGARRRPS